MTDILTTDFVPQYGQKPPEPEPPSPFTLSHDVAFSLEADRRYYVALMYVDSAGAQRFAATFLMCPKLDNAETVGQLIQLLEKNLGSTAVVPLFWSEME